MQRVAVVNARNTQRDQSRAVRQRSIRGSLASTKTDSATRLPGLFRVFSFDPLIQPAVLHDHQSDQHSLSRILVSTEVENTLRILLSASSVSMHCRHCKLAASLLHYCYII